MKKEILIRMVGIDGIEGKKMKLMEEITELRFALLEGTRENIIEELAQVNFVEYQLESVGLYMRSYLDDMLKKYDLVSDYRRYLSRNWKDIQKRENFEYERNMERLGLVD